MTPGFVRCFVIVSVVGISLVTVTPADEHSIWNGKIVQYGKMREAIGQQQDQGRVRLNYLTAHPHFYGVAALAGLQGEVTIRDGKVTTTRVASAGRLTVESESLDLEATLLVGSYVPSWTTHSVNAPVAPAEFDTHIMTLARKCGLIVSQPFPFLIEGEFSDVSLHVIHGACPLHARLHKRALPPELQPYEADLKRLTGAVVGIYAVDAVGDITHPATSTHMHLLFVDPQSGENVTGHVEQLGLLQNCVVRLPRVK
ncbi:MAG: acetolactate decarboxylase [Pirellulaceae bacterium]